LHRRCDTTCLQHLRLDDLDDGLDNGLAGNESAVRGSAGPSRSSEPEGLAGNEQKENIMNTQALTQLEFAEEDFELAERIARRLGFTQTAYTSTSALWGLFCLPDRPTQRKGCIIKTRELGLMFVQDVEDLLMQGVL